MTDYNFVTRKGKFDAGHRVMHERFKCFNVHGHEYHYELTFSYPATGPLGYAIDFKEIKRVACQWIDDRFDHGFIANPKDLVMVNACRAVSSKLYVMSLVDAEGFCNPSAENIAKEIFFAVGRLMFPHGIYLKSVKLHETVNCYVECTSLSAEELKCLDSALGGALKAYAQEKGVVEYDERKA